MDHIAEFFAKNDVVLMGASGAGKTTFIEHLFREVPVRYISLGSITRSRVEYGDEELATMVKKGGVWPLDYVLSLIEPHLNIQHPYVLDGLPKHLAEAEWLAQHLRLRPQPTQIILLQAPEPDIRRRAIDRPGRPETLPEIDSRIHTFRTNIGLMLKILSPSIDSEVIKLDGLTSTPPQLVQTLRTILEDRGGEK